MAGTKKTQRRLTLSREEKFAALDAAVLTVPGKRSYRAGRDVRALIKQIELCSGRDGSHVRVEVLAGRLDVSTRTVRRWIRRAEQLGILTVNRHRRGSSHYRIQWDAIAARGDQRGQSHFPSAALHENRDSPQPEKVVTPERKLSGHTECCQGSADKLAAQTGQIVSARPVRSLVQTLPPPPTPSGERMSKVQAPMTKGEAAAGCCFVGDWKRIVERLQRLGMSEASALIARARASDEPVEPHYIAELIDHWRARPGAWKLGGLHYRIRTARPGQAIDDGWPPPAESYVRTRTRQASDRRYEQTQRNVAKERRDRKAEAVEWEQDIEKIFGPELDAMSQEELDCLAFTTFAGESAMIARYRRDGAALPGFVRDGLLLAISEAGRTKGRTTTENTEITEEVTQ